MLVLYLYFINHMRIYFSSSAWNLLLFSELLLQCYNELFGVPRENSSQARKIEINRSTAWWPRVTIHLRSSQIQFVHLTMFVFPRHGTGTVCLKMDATLNIIPICNAQLLASSWELPLLRGECFRLLPDKRSGYKSTA